MVLIFTMPQLMNNSDRQSEEPKHTEQLLTLRIIMETHILSIIIPMI